MYTESQKPDRTRLWRLGLLALVGLPFLPEALALITAAAARMSGCSTVEKGCPVGPLAASMVKLATETSILTGEVFGAGAVVVWLVACYVAISFGWSRLTSRLLLALAVTLVFASLPYFAPALALMPFTHPKCQPNEGGVGPCEIYGREIGPVVHETAALPWALLFGAPLAFTAFALYAIVAIILRVRSRRPTAPATNVGLEN